MKLLRLKPGHGEVVLAEGDVEVPEEEQLLIEAFRRQLDAGMWAAVPSKSSDGRRTAELVRQFADVPRERHARTHVEPVAVVHVRAQLPHRAAGGAQRAES